MPGADPMRCRETRHREDASHAFFHVLIFCLIRVPESKDLCIAMADRWCHDPMEAGMRALQAVL